MTLAIAHFGDKPIHSVQTELENCAANGLDPSIFSGRANSFVCTSGAEPGRGYLLMLRSDVDDLLNSIVDADTDQYFEMVLGVEETATEAAALGSELRERRFHDFPNMVLVKASRLYPGETEGSTKPLMLVEIADRRINLIKSTINRAYNMESLTPISTAETGDAAETDENRYWCATLRKPVSDGDADPENDAETCSPWTWREILEDIWCYIHNGVVGTESWNTFPELPLDYDTDDWDSIPHRVQCYGMSALVAFCNVLKMFGGAVLCFNPLEDEFNIEFHGRQNQDLDDLLTDMERFRLFLSEETEYIVPILPNTVGIGMLTCTESNNEDFRSFPLFVEEYLINQYLTARSFSADAVIVQETSQIIYGWYDLLFYGLSGATCEQTDEECDQEQFLQGQRNLDPVLAAKVLAVAYRYWDSLIDPWYSREDYQGVIAAVPCSRIDQVVWGDLGDGMKTRLTYDRLAEVFQFQRLLPPRDGEGNDVYVITQDDNQGGYAAFWRCNPLWNADGIEAKPILGDYTDCNFTTDPALEPTIIYGRLFHNVLVTGDMTQVRSVLGSKEILTTGESFWGSAITLADITTSGLVELWSGGPPVLATSFEGTIAAGTTCIVQFDDHAQLFYITHVICPP